jgi:hypothetical protein
MQKFPVSCPSCEKALAVSELTCPNCDTVVSGNYPLPLLLQLPIEDQDFLFQFIKTGGSLKKMAKHLGKSYPTVRNKLDDILEKIKQLENQTKKQ